MQILLGLSLDASSYPPLPGDKQAVIGQLQTGPLGLLQLLEGRLGLAGNWESEPFRIEIYRQRLMAADNGERFFSKSLKVDSPAVASALLSWRDELVLGGWDFSTGNGIPTRLADLAAVEVLSQPASVPYGFADRLRGVIAALPLDQFDIKRIQLLENSTYWGPGWEALFTKLKQSGVIIEDNAPMSASAPGDLGLAQAALCKGGKKTATGDGSLVILQTSSDSEAADLLGAWLADTKDSDRLLVIPPGDRTLERVFDQYGMPSLGLSSYSSLRPILQVLPLACELLWDPIDPYRLLEFLSLPNTPIKRWVARRLSEALAAAPGIGGRPWQAALAEIQNTIVSGAYGTQTWSDIETSIKTWVACKRYSPAKGIPKAELSAVAKRIAQWAAGQSSGVLKQTGVENEQFNALSAQASHLSRIIDSIPENTVGKPQLHRILHIIQGQGQALGAETAAGHTTWIHAPGALTAPAQEIIWSGFTGFHAPVFRRSPWLISEKEYLSSKGVLLPEPKKYLEAASVADERAVLGAVKRLILVAPEREAGSDTTMHPLYDRLSVIFGDSIRNLCVTGDEWLKGKSMLPPLKTCTLSSRNLPLVSRYWKLTDKAIPPRATESYSSLNLLFETPFKWVLNYHAKLRSVPIQSIGGQKKLMGNVTHRVFEQLFTTGEDCIAWKEMQVEARVEQLLNELFTKEAAAFLLPRFITEKQSLMRKIKKAAWIMATHIRENGWKVEGTEYATNGFLGKQPTEGNIDLVLIKPGSKAIVDLKWSRSKYHYQSLTENRALQLVLYAHMLDNKTLPHIAYFSLPESVLLAPDRQAFKNARLSPLPPGETLELLLDKMEKTYLFRLAQLSQGLIEVPVEGTLPDLSVIMPPDLLIEQDKLFDPREYGALVGWPEGSNA